MTCDWLYTSLYTDVTPLPLPCPPASGPKTIEEITLINAGRPLDNSKTLAESRVPVAEIPGTPLTMHVVVHPPHTEKQAGMGRESVQAGKRANEWVSECVSE